jgi:hypothetical protein
VMEILFRDIWQTHWHTDTSDFFFVSHDFAFLV